MTAILRFFKVAYGSIGTAPSDSTVINIWLKESGGAWIRESGGNWGLEN